MGLFRILSLMFMVARVFGTRIPLCVQPHGEAGVPTESTENCLCSAGLSTIIKSLDPDNSGVERLVIYIYRKLNTGEIIAFTPHRQLQHQIPDFPEEYGIINEINDQQSIIEIFDNSPSKEMRGIKPENSIIPGRIYAPRPSTKPSNNKAKPAVIVTDKWWNRIHARLQDYKNIKQPSWLIPVVKPHPEHAPASNGYRPADFPEDYIVPYRYRPEHSDSDNYPIHVTPEDSYEETNSLEDADSEKPIVSDIPLDYYDTPTNPHSHVPNAAHNAREDYLVYPASGENEPNRENGPIKYISESAHSHIQVHPFGPIEHTHGSNDYIQPDEKEWNVPKANKIRVPRKDNRGRITDWQIINTYRGDKSHNNLVRPEINKVRPYHIDDDINDDRDGKVPNKVPLWPGYHHSVSNRVIKVKPINYHKDISHLSDDKYGYHEQVPSFDYWLERQLNITTINGNKLPTNDIIALHTAIRNTLLQNGLVVTKHGTLVDGHGMVSNLDNLKLRPILIGKSISFNRFMRNVQSDINFTIPPNSPSVEGLLLTMIKPPKILGIVPLSRSSISHKLGQKHYGKLGKSFKVLPISHLVSFRKDSSKPQRLSKPKHHSNTKISKADQSEQSEPTKHGPKEEGVEDRYLGQTTEGVSEEVPDFRIIGGMSATVSGTPLLNRGRSGRDYEYDEETEPFISRNDQNPIAEQFSSRYGNIEEDDGGTL